MTCSIWLQLCTYCDYLEEPDSLIIMPQLNITVTSPWRLKSLASYMFTQQLVHANINARRSASKFRWDGLTTYIEIIIYRQQRRVDHEEQDDICCGAGYKLRRGAFKILSAKVFNWTVKNGIQLNTWRNNNVAITSKRRHFCVITSKWHRIDVIRTSLLHNVFAG